MIFAWERSGNGFGQHGERDQRDAGWGHVDPKIDLVDGGDRGSYVNLKYGRRSHHLYLWHIGDTMGVLKNVLGVLSGEVALD